jgi:hypothetical protein
MSTENVKLGVCKIFFDGRDLGLTKGGVEVSVQTETYKVEVDQFGKTPVKELVMGRTVTVTAPLAETTIENMAALMPGATVVTTGVAPNQVTRLDVDTGTGIDLLDVAKVLRLHPINKPDADKSEDFVIYKAATPGALTFAYKLDEERIFNANFTAYPDPVSGKLFSIGDADDLP